MRTIRPATERDVPRLVDIARAAFLSAFSEHAPAALLEQWQRSDREPAWYRRDWPEMHVLEQDEIVIGVVQPKRDEINGLWVHPDWHGMGAGSALLATGEALIQSAGYHRAWLTCSTFNPRALRFYHRRGYVEAGREHTSHLCGVEEESHRLERQIGGSTK